MVLGYFGTIDRILLVRDKPLIEEAHGNIPDSMHMIVF